MVEVPFLRYVRIYFNLDRLINDFVNFRELVKSGTLNDFIHHETLSSNEVQAKLKLKEPLGLLWQYVLITVNANS